MLIGAEGARLLRDEQVTGDPTGAYAPRRLPDRPAESERLSRKSTVYLTQHNLKKWEWKK